MIKYKCIYVFIHQSPAQVARPPSYKIVNCIVDCDFTGED